jgi:hypothetical protein
LYAVKKASSPVTGKTKERKENAQLQATNEQRKEE